MKQLDYAVVVLAGVCYAVLPEAALRRVCRSAGATCNPESPAAEEAVRQPPDASALAAKLIERRRAAGLTQAALARRAGVRVETLNRIERGRTTPDFATIRKLVNAMNRVEARTR